VASSDKTKEYAQLVKKLKILNEKKKVYRSKAIYNWKERKKLELLFNKVKQERDTANSLLSEAKQTLQEFQEELLRKSKSREEAWKKASESSAELEVLKQQFNSLKSALQDKHSDPSIQSKAHCDATSSSEQADDITKLRKALAATLHKADLKDLSIRRLKKQKRVLLNEKRYLKKKIYQQAKAHQLREAKYKVNLELKSNEIDSLNIENTRLRKLQLETNQNQGKNNDRIVKQLRETILTMKIKLNKTENLVKDTKKLERERQVQESAIELLSNDLDALNKEKAQLSQESDRLSREMDLLKNQNLYQSVIQETSDKKAGLSIKMLQL
jgi:hypothetical protein